MNRRDFLMSTIGAPLTAASASAETVEQTAGREYYELRLYHLRRGPKVKLTDDYFRQVALPALKRAGTGPIGVFNVQTGPDSPTLYVLITHKSIQSVTETAARLAADKDYQTAGAEFLARPAADPAYTRMESSLMAAFSGIPNLEVPAGTTANKPRLFELRTYESHGEAAGLKKVEMFNNGEIAIFRRAGINPVFFGQTIVGSRMPNLTYMVVFDDMASHDKAWGTFVADPEWKKLSATPGYMDAEIVTNISNVFLRPTPYSQI
jgi:hypothetical protein